MVDHPLRALEDTMNFTIYKNKIIQSSLFVLLSLVILTPSQAQAEGFALQDWSARGLSLAGGLIAREADPSAAAFNPAAITELEGLQVQAGLEFVKPHNTIVIENHPTNPAAHGSYDASDIFFLVPNAYATYKLNDNISLGLAIFSRFGAGNEYDKQWPGSANMHYVNLLTSTFNPTIAWRVNDTLSLAAGIEISGAMVELQQGYDLGAAGFVNSTLKNKDISYAFAYNLAAHLRFNEQWSAGLTYRSAVSYEFEGELKFDPQPLASTVGLMDAKGTTTMNLPYEIKFGLAYAPIEKLSLEANVAYYGWSSYQDLDLHMDGGGVISNPKEWQDTWLFGFSAEYDVNDWLTLRGGISYETNPIPSSHLEYMSPTGGRWKYALGAGIKHNDWTFDLGYAFHHLNNVNFDDSTVNGVFDGHTKSIYAHSLSASISYRF